MKKIIFTFESFNPPTKEHFLFVEDIRRTAKRQNSDYIVFGNPKKDISENPLMPSSKEVYMKRILNDENVRVLDEISSPFDAIKFLENCGYKDITFITTENKYKEFQNTIPKFVGVDFDIDKFQLEKTTRPISLSEETARDIALEGKLDVFRLHLPPKVSPTLASNLLKDIQIGSGIKSSLNESWFDYDEFSSFIKESNAPKEKIMKVVEEIIENNERKNFSSFITESSPALKAMRQDKEMSRGTGVYDHRTKDAARKRVERADAESKKGSIKDYYIVHNTESGIYELVNRKEKHLEPLTGPDETLRPTTLSELIRVFKDKNKTFRITPTSKKFLPKSLVDDDTAKKYGDAPAGKGSKKAIDASSGQRDQTPGSEELPGLEEPTTRSSEFMELDSIGRSQFVKSIMDTFDSLTISNSDAQSINPSSPNVKEWFNASRSLYDAYKEEPDRIEMYATPAELKDFVNRWEELQSIYDKESEMIDTIKTAKSLASTKTAEDFKSFSDRIKKTNQAAVFKSTNNAKKRLSSLEKNHKNLWNNQDLAKEITGMNSILYEIADLATGLPQYKSPQNGNIIQKFIGDNYENDAWQLSKISKQIFGLDENDFRIKKKLNDCNNGTNAQLDCGSTENSFSPKDIKAFSDYRKMQMNLMKLSGLLQEDNTFLAYRLYYDKDKLYKEGSGVYTGSYADSWTLSSQSIEDEWGKGLSETMDTLSLDKKNLFILKSRISLNQMVTSFLSDIPSDKNYSDKDLNGIKMFDGNASFDDHNQKEIVLNSSEYLPVEIVPYDKSSIDTLTEGKKNQRISIKDKYNLNWMRAMNEDSFVNYMVEPSDPNFKPYTIVIVNGKEKKIDIDRDIVESVEVKIVNYKLSESNIQGTGTFSNKNIMPGEIIGRYLSSYLNEDGNEYQQRTELCRFTNHSKESSFNVVPMEDGNFYAVANKFIPEGEELTIYYPDVYQIMADRIEKGSFGSIPEVDIIADEYKNIRIPIDSFKDIYDEYNFLKKTKQLHEKERDYKKEYKEYHGKPEQIKRRARRVQARRDMEAEGRVHKGDGKDIDHKDGNPMNNNTSNLKVSSIHHNRSRNNNKELREELGAGEWGTFELLRKYLNDTPFMQIQNHKVKENKVDVRNCRDNK